MGVCGGCGSSARQDKFHRRAHPKATFAHDVFKRRCRVTSVGIRRKGFRAASGADWQVRGRQGPLVHLHGEDHRQMGGFRITYRRFLLQGCAGRRRRAWVWFRFRRPPGLPDLGCWPRPQHACLKPQKSLDEVRRRRRLEERSAVRGVLDDPAEGADHLEITTIVRLRNAQD